VTVGPALQVGEHKNVFAIGDVSTADAKMAGMAGMQAQLTAENILRLVNGEHHLAPYEPYGAAIVVPIGPEGGSGQLPGQDELASREWVATVKGRDLMVDRYAETMGLPTGEPQTSHTDEPEESR
jgi:NADH dehydrogenase FAD-containing subunit